MIAESRKKTQQLFSVLILKMGKYFEKTFNSN